MSTVSAGQTVYIVDDEDLVRKSMHKLMESVGYPSQGFSSAEEFIPMLDSIGHGCILIDVCMPNLSGLELQRILNERRVEIPVIIISGHADVPMAVRALKEGAVDFVEKPYKSEELLVKVRKCLEGEQRKQATSELRKQVAQRMASLTQREIEVVNGLVDGKRNKEIATDLSLSRRTVEAYRASVMEKLEANTLSDIVRQVLLWQAD